MLPASPTLSVKINNQFCLRFVDNSPVKLKIPEEVQKLMQDDCLVVGGYIRDEIAKLIYNGHPIALPSNLNMILYYLKIEPVLQKYLPLEKPYIDIDLVTGLSAEILQARGFKKTFLKNYYQTRRGGKDSDKILKIGVFARQSFTPEAELKERDFYSNTFLMDKNGIVYDVSGLALIAVLTKSLLMVSLHPYVAFSEDIIKLLRALYFQASDSYAFTPKLKQNIQAFASDSKTLAQAWNKVESGRKVSLWGRFFSEGAGCKFFSKLEENNLISFFFPPLNNWGEAACNVWIKSRLAEIDRQDYYNFEQPAIYFYAVVIAAVKKYHNSPPSIQELLNQWGVSGHINICEEFVAKFAAITDLTCRTKPKSQIDLMHLALQEAEKKHSNNSVLSASPITTVTTAAVLTLASASPILDVSSSPLMLPRASSVVTTNQEQASKSVSPNSPLINTSSPVSGNFSPLILPVSVIANTPQPHVAAISAHSTDKIELVPQAILTTTAPPVEPTSNAVLSTISSVTNVPVDQSTASLPAISVSAPSPTMAAAKTKSPIMPSVQLTNRARLRVNAAIFASKNEAVKTEIVTVQNVLQPESKHIIHVAEATTTNTDFNAQHNQVLSTTVSSVSSSSKYHEARESANSETKVTSKNKLKKEKQAGLKEMYLHLQVQRQIQQAQEKQEKLAAKQKRKEQSPVSIQAQQSPITQSIPIVIAMSSAISSGKVNTTASTLASMSTTLAKIISSSNSVSSSSATVANAYSIADPLPVSTSSITFVDSKESKYSANDLPKQIYMCDYIGGPIYLMCKKDFTSLDIKLTPEEQSNLNNTSLSYGCCYCGCIYGWRVCQCDKMATISLEIPDSEEVVSACFGTTHFDTKIMRKADLSSLLVWKSLMNGNSCSCTDDTNAKKILIAHEEMMEIFKQSRVLSKPITIQRHQFTIVSFGEWDMFVQRNYNNERLASSEYFNRSNGLASASIISLLNSILNLRAFWRYEDGTYSCNLGIDYASRLQDIVAERDMAKWTVTRNGEESWKICLSELDVEKLALIEQQLGEERKPHQSRCSSLSSCVML